MTIRTSRRYFSTTPYGRRGIAIRLIYLAIAVVWRALQSLRIVARPRCVTLCYHGVRRDQRDAFRRQMMRVASRAITIEKAVDLPAHSCLPRVSVTFDDGFANLLNNAIPITNEFDIPVSIFLVTGRLGAPPCWALPQDHLDTDEPLMTCADIRSLAVQRNITIGSHTVTHPTLPTLDDSTLDHELAVSRRALEALVGRPIVDLAVPHGACDSRVAHTAESAGYKRVFTLYPSSSNVGSGLKIVGRYSMCPDTSLIELRLTIDGAYAWLPYVRRVVRAAQRHFVARRHLHYARILLSRLRMARDAWIDQRLGIRTTVAPVDHITRIARHNDCVHYEPLHYHMVFRVLKDLEISSHDIVYDVGSGLGRILFASAKVGAKRCVGIELSEELATLAAENAASFTLTGASIETHIADAASANYADGTVYILHNPFGEQTLRTVLNRIRDSVRARPRDVRIAYIVPNHEHVLAQCEWLTRDGEWSPRYSRIRATYWRVNRADFDATAMPDTSTRDPQNEQPMRAELICGGTGLREIEEEWHALFDRAPNATPHRSPAWAMAHIASDSLQGQPCALVAWRGAEIAALLALERRTIAGTEVVRPLGTGIPGSLGVLCDPQTPRAIDVLAEAIIVRGWDALQFDDLAVNDPPTNKLCAALGAPHTRTLHHSRTRTHIVDLQPTFDQYLQRSKSARRRRKLRHEWKTLETSARVDVEHERGSAVTVDMIERCITLQQRSWMKRRGAATLCDDLHQNFLRHCADAELLHIWILTLDGQDAAFVIGLECGDTLHYAWTAFDLQYEILSVGKYLTARVIEHACRNGFSKLDFGQGEAEYKAFWATHSYAVERCAIGITHRGRLYVAALAWSWRVRKWKLVRSIWYRLNARKRALSNDTHHTSAREEQTSSAATHGVGSVEQEARQRRAA